MMRTVTAGMWVRQQIHSARRFTYVVASPSLLDPSSGAPVKSNDAATESEENEVRRCQGCSYSS